MYYVYLLKSVKFPETYIGLTDNLPSRIDDHNNGKSLHTSKYRLWKLVNYFAFRDKQSAASFEKYLKTDSGRAFAHKHFL